jgi:DNA-binding NarL/FixJ family response regulator
MIATTEKSTGSSLRFFSTHAPVAVPARSPVRVWLTDDNAGFRNLLAQLLARSGEFDCEQQFHSAESLLAGLASEPAPDVILLDVEMGGLTGVDALRPIRTLAPNVRVLIVTTFFDPMYERRASSEGASGFLIKAHAPQILIGAIHQALALPIRLPEVAPVDFHQAAMPTARPESAVGKTLIARLTSWMTNISPALFGQLDYQRPAATPK